MGWKLVRDRNKQWCLAHGISGRWRTSPSPVNALRRKLFEEVGEYVEVYDPAELYDLIDVVLMLIELEDPDGEARRAHSAKIAEMGSFGRFVEWSPVPEFVQDWSPDER